MKHAEKRKGGCLKKLLSVLLCIVLAITAVSFFTGNLSTAEKFFMKAFYPQKYSEFVEKASEDYGLDESLIYAVIRTESSFNPDALSGAGAKGLMQLMPESFEWLQKLRNENLDNDELFDPETNIDYGCYLLKYFLDYYKTEQCAIAAYNAGFVVSDWLENKEYSHDGCTLYNIPYKETSNYVDKVENARNMYIKLYYGETKR